ncbi:MAG TPA: ABC transporter permease [Bryobacteraceae bacterium]|jgi:putative ABC transport system permease protein|nr:ABC transporter permease [Bryobacteraceae bacterium]
MSDWNYAFRMLFRNPAFTLAAVVVLGLGIGASTVVFTLVHAILLEPLPYPKSERLIYISATPPHSGQGTAGMLGPDFVEFRDHNRSFEKMAAYVQGLWILSGAGDGESINGVRVSPGYFETLGVAPILGRGFAANEQWLGHEWEVIFSYRFWQRKFGGDPAIIGRRVTLDGRAYEVVGIAPPDFPAANEFDMWAPLQMDGPFIAGRRYRNLRVFGRLKDGVPLGQAQAEANAFAADLAARNPDDQGFTLQLVTFLDREVGAVRKTLWIFAAAVGCVLLIACSNVASLLLARGASRVREMAVRAALGASRAVLIRQMLVESVALALGGGALGIGLAWAGLRLLIASAPKALPRSGNIHIDAGVLCFAFLAALATGVIFGIVPALRGSRVNLSEAIKDGGRSGTAGRSSHRFRAALVVVEVALGVLLMAGAGLFLRTFQALVDVRPGYNVRNVLILQIAAIGSHYRAPEDWRRFFDRLIPELERIPGVESAGSANLAPLDPQRNSTSLWLDTQSVRSEQTKIRLDNRVVTPNYFRAMGVPLIAGRMFDENDRPDTPHVLMVNEAFAREFYPQGAVGHQVTLDVGTGSMWTAEIVGVVGNYRETRLGDEPKGELFTALAQTTIAGQTLVLRTTGDPAGYVAAVRRTVASIDPDVPVYNVRTMRQQVSDSLMQHRLRLLLLGTFSGLALVLAAIGLYGVIACAVAERKQEIGIRMALGAPRQRVIALVLRSGLNLTVAGLLIGITAAFGATRLIASFLYGVTPWDPVTFAFTAAIFVGVAIAASYLPARRATRIDPVQALREE